MATEKLLTKKIADDGLIVIPMGFRRALGINPGDEVVLRMADGEVHIASRVQARRGARKYVQGLVSKSVSLADELIRERKEEDAGD